MKTNPEKFFFEELVILLEKYTKLKDSEKNNKSKLPTRVYWARKKNANK